MAMYKSYSFDYIKFFENCCVGELELLFDNQLEKDILLNFWNHIQYNRGSDLIDQYLVDEYMKVRRDSQEQDPYYWTGIDL